MTTKAAQDHVKTHTEPAAFNWHTIDCDPSHPYVGTSPELIDLERRATSEKPTAGRQPTHFRKIAKANRPR